MKIKILLSLIKPLQGQAEAISLGSVCLTVVIITGEYSFLPQLNYWEREGGRETEGGNPPIFLHAGGQQQQLFECQISFTPLILRYGS